ncbi:hypothetical protein [Streptomyces sp. NPDC002122]|uniref:hypothetical protein n=1 Tax=Streptomyces sp. NPDC002122 TaxID=3154407 RepID=UPI0033213FAD
MRDTVQPPGQAVPARTTSSLTTPVKTSVLYQPVPGLTEVQGGTGLATDFAYLHADAREVDRLRARLAPNQPEWAGRHLLVHSSWGTCLFVSDNGTEIDFDFAADRREIFDL